MFLVFFDPGRVFSATSRRPFLVAESEARGAERVVGMVPVAVAVLSIARHGGKDASCPVFRCKLRVCVSVGVDGVLYGSRDRAGFQE